MSISPNVRNVGIVLILALAVFALPGGGTGAQIISTLISLLFGLGIGLFAMRLYRENRMTIHGLGDQYRTILYASLAGILFLGAAARNWWDDPALTIVWFAGIALAVWGLVATYRHWRAYA